MTRVAILDDYQGVALRPADWASLPADVVVFRDDVSDESSVAARLADFDVVVAMRERTLFPRTLIARLPRLRLLVTTGMRSASIDLRAAAETLGVPGLGQLSSRAARVGLAFKLEMLVWSQNLTAERAAAAGATLAGSKDELRGIPALGAPGESARIPSELEIDREVR